MLWSEAAASQRCTDTGMEPGDQSWPEYSPARGYWETKAGGTFPPFPKLYVALVTGGKFHLVRLFPCLEGQRRCSAAVDECSFGHS